MGSILHLVHKDGSVEHVPLDKGSWNSAVRSRELANFWGHPEGDCRNPVEEHRARRERLAQVKIELGKVQTAPSSGGVKDWTPTTELTPEQLSWMSGLCLQDCRDVLHPLPKDIPLEDIKPMDKDGQWLLF